MGLLRSGLVHVVKAGMARQAASKARWSRSWARSTIGGQPGDQGGERAVVVREHHHLVAGQVGDQTHRRVDRPLLGPGQQHVLAGHIGEAAVAAQGRCA